MSRLDSFIEQRDPVRAVFLTLVVLAQLILASTCAVVRAADANSCASITGFSEAGKSKQSAQLHGQQCAHCRPQLAVLAAPIEHPELAVAAAFKAHIALDDVEAVAVALEPLPPPTGPPASRL
ncbi:MAG: hypothetical protein GC190_05025 [Alphaproteobacteria bacterium]|nr:hypothetical protein [Alphaproteobacteria bacterium]